MEEKLEVPSVPSEFMDPFPSSWGTFFTDTQKEEKLEVQSVLGEKQEFYGVYGSFSPLVVDHFKDFDCEIDEEEIPFGSSGDTVGDPMKKTVDGNPVPNEKDAQTEETSLENLFDKYPPGLGYNPTDEEVVDSIDNEKNKMSPFVKFADMNSVPPWELQEVQLLKKEKVKNLHFWGNREPKNGKVIRSGKFGTWKARGVINTIKTKKGNKAEKRQFLFIPDTKYKKCVKSEKWIMDEYVRVRGEEFEELAIWKIRMKKSLKKIKEAKMDDEE